MKDTFNGVVKVAIINKGSKSEKPAALLVQDDGYSLRLHLDGDRNYTNLESFGEYEGQRVSVTGENEGGTLIVKSKSDIKPQP